MSYKILHTESSLGWGGQELRVIAETSGLIARGFDCRIVCDPKSQFWQRSTPDVFNSLISARISRKTFIGLFAAREIIKRFKPDIISTHSSTDSWLFFIANLTIILGPRARLVRTRHVSASVKNSFLNRRFYRLPDIVVTTSSDIRSSLINTLDLPTERVISVPTGIDVNYYLPKRSDVLDKSHVSLVMVSTLRSWKGHDFAIEAMKDLPDATLTIVGDGPREIHLKKLVENWGLTSRVFFAGYQKNVTEFLAKADIFLHPSYANEGVSQALLQACSMAKIIIASNIGGLNEVVEHGKTGYLIDPASSREIVKAIESIMHDPRLWSERASKARDVVAEKYSLDVMVDQMEVIYNQCIKGVGVEKHS